MKLLPLESHDGGESGNTTAVVDGKKLDPLPYRVIDKMDLAEMDGSRV